MKPIKELRYYEEIDFIKALAIMAVVILHSFKGSEYSGIFASFHIWQAIPVFMIIAGISSSIAIMKKGVNVKKPLQRLLIPYSICWIIYVLFMYKGSLNITVILFSYFKGVGVGAYFVPLFVQHILLFPLVWKVFDKTKQDKVLIVFFMISVILECICIACNVEENLYSSLYVRHLFAMALGVYFVRYGVRKRFLIFWAGLSAVFIYLTAQIGYNKMLYTVLYPVVKHWSFDHAPSYFYSLFLIIVLWKVYYLIKPLAKHVLLIGKSSFHIYLIQALFFMRFGIYASHRFVLNLLICIGIGYLFYRNQPRIECWLKNVIKGGK